MVVLGTLLSGREFAWLFFGPFAVQSWFQKTQKDLGYRASTLRVGRVATEENQSSPKRGIKLPTFFVPDSRVPSTTMTFGCGSMQREWPLPLRVLHRRQLDQVVDDVGGLHLDHVRVLAAQGLLHQQPALYVGQLHLDDAGRLLDARIII